MVEVPAKLRLYCDEACHDTFTVPLNLVHVREGRIAFEVSKRCVLRFDEDEFDSLAFDLLSTSGKSLFSYRVNKRQILECCHRGRHDFLGKRGRLSKRGSTKPSMICMVRQMSDKGIIIKDIEFKLLV